MNHEYFMRIACEAAQSSTCLKRKVGAVIVNNGIIIARGANGGEREYPNCLTLEPKGVCYWKRMAYQIARQEQADFNGERFQTIKKEANGDFSMLDSKSLSMKSTSKAAFTLNDIIGIPMDYLALSFVEDTNEIKGARSIFGDVKIIGKIETITGVKKCSQILEESDGVMIARGDLGLNAPINTLFAIEKELAGLAKEKGKVCYVATDIMQTMRNRFFPSRADINDFSYLTTLGLDGYIISLQLAVSEHIDTAIDYMRAIDDSLR